MAEALNALVEHMREIEHLNAALGLMGWDQQVLLPSGAAAARAAQQATLARLAHEKFTSKRTAELLDAAAAETSALPYDSDEASFVRVTRADYEENTKIPSELVAERARLTGLANEVWVKARANDDFAHFVPMLSQLVDNARKIADSLGYSEHPYDALLNMYERGITSNQVKTIFDEHKTALAGLISRISQVGDRVSDAPVHQHFPTEKQREFGLSMIKVIGFDFERGRQDVSVHPFASGIHRTDVRLTTRFDESFLNPALFGIIHEAGHGMYEQGVSANWDNFPSMGSGTSLGVHESQSRMWENIVGRSKGFWTWAYPQLQATFPDQLKNVDLDAFHKAVNKVEPSFIRVEADEATYNLHIMLRFELEMEMISGAVKVENLASEWNQRFEAMIGVTPPNNALGVLQDIHWSFGLIGYFATYALGNMLAAQYYRKALADRPSIPADIANGKFDTLLTWLNENIHQHGRKFTGDELTRRITGEGIQSKYYMQYLEEKYTEIYGL